MCYDVNLKLYSSHLLLMSIFLLAPEFEWLTGAMVWRKPAQPRAPVPLVRHRPVALSLLTAQIVLGVAVLATLATREFRRSHRWDLPHGPLYGIWAVEEFGAPAPPEFAWRRVVFDDPVYAYHMDFSIQAVDGSARTFLLHYDPGRQTMGLSSGATLFRCYIETDGDHWDDYRQRELLCPIDASFTFERPQPDLLILDGRLDDRQIHARLRRTPHRAFPLTAPTRWPASTP